MEKPPKVAVVILNWNGKKFLSQFLPSVISTTYPNLEIIVADNASTDDSVEFTQKTFPDIKIIRLNENKGFATGYNQALGQVEADYYVLLNQDVEVSENWVTPVIEMMESDPLIAACQPKLKAQTSKDHFEYAGAAGGFIDHFGYTFCRGRIFDHLEKDLGQYDKSSEIFWASGAAMFIRAKLYHQFEGLDDDFFAHMEEIDLCWRLKNAGYKIMYCPGSTVFHVGGGSLPQGNPRKTYLNFRNNLRMIIKNMPSAELRRKLPVRMALDNLAAFHALISGKTGDFKAILKANQYMLSHFGKWRKKRKDVKMLVKKHRVGPPNYQGVLSKSIILQFFFKKRKKFSELEW